jgi:RNA polymerase sigma factor (sigma-70 family)
MQAQANTGSKALSHRDHKMSIRESKMTLTAFENKNTLTSGAVEASLATTAPLDILQLFHQHRTHLLRFVQRYVRNADDAEDVVQNTFLEAMRCADRFCGLSKPSTWLFGIALNVARNQVRRNCQDRYETVDETFMEQIVDLHADPAKLCELRDIAGKIDALLNTLPKHIRSTFEAVLGGEATYEEAANRLHIPVGTVRSRVSRVRAAIRLECS